MRSRLQPSREEVTLATARPVGLVEACRDRRLLGVDLSPRQAELATAIEASATLICAAGRQSGKSLIAAAAMVANLLLRPDLDAVAAGSARYALAVANSREQATILLGFARRLVEESPVLRSLLVGSREDTLAFTGERFLVAMPCQDRLLRGLSASMVVLDEFGHFRTETEGPAVAERIYSALRPSLAVYGERARLVAISTPYGDNLFARLHARASSGELGPGAVSFTAATAEMNPRVSREFLEGERLQLGALDFEREYEAVFGAGAGNFFEEDAVRDVVGDYRELSREEGVGWLVGFDPSFSVDPSAAAAVGRSRSDRSQLVVGRVERWLPAKSRRKRARQSTADRQEVVDAVLDGVAAMAGEFGGCPVVTDQHLPATVIEGLRARGVRRVVVRAWTAQTQTDAFRALRAKVYAGAITLPADEQLVSELCRLRSKLRAGSSQIEIPRSGESHCDLAVATASAVLELERHPTGSLRATAVPDARIVEPDRSGFRRFPAGRPELSIGAGFQHPGLSR